MARVHYAKPWVCKLVQGLRENSLALVWAEGYFHAVVQRLWEGTRVGEGGAETDGQKLATQAPAWPDLCQFGLSSPTSAIKSLTGTTEAQGSDACFRK